MDFIQACARLREAPPRNRRPPSISTNGGATRYCFASEDDCLYRLTDNYTFASNSSPCYQEIMSSFWRLDLGEDYND